MTQSSDQSASFVSTITKIVFESGGGERIENNESTAEFPLKIIVDPSNSSSTQSSQELKNHLTMNGYSWKPAHQNIEVSLLRLEESNNLVNHLAEHAWNFSFDYSSFANHPGLLLVKGLNRSKSSEEELKSFFNSKSRFRSLNEVSFISLSAEDNTPTVAAVLKFENYVDADMLLENPPDATNFAAEGPLTLCRYVKKRDRSKNQADGLITGLPSSSANFDTTQDDSMEYDTVVIENFCDFLGGPTTVEVIQQIIAKFLLFHKIERVYFPVTKVDSEKFAFKKCGYIKFTHSRELMSDTLKCLYYLNDLTQKELLDFSSSNIYEIQNDVNAPTPIRKGSKNSVLKLVIAQRKHNHYLFQNRDNAFLTSIGLPELTFVESPLDDLVLVNDIAKSFTKNSNYQETNVYVNNFPILFENNDELWAEFWNQFGVDCIKSARIIKPQFYSKRSEGPLGKIGFVFYEDFRMALRAIILTNNKVVTYKNHPSILIQTSFAIQKGGHSSVSNGKMPPSKYSLNSTPEYNYFPPPDNPYMHRMNLHMNDSYYFMDLPYARNESPPQSPPFFNPGDGFVYNPYILPIQYPSNHTDEDTRKEEEGLNPHKSLKTISAGQPMPSNQYPVPYGYYYLYYPYSSPMRMNPMQPVPMNGPLLPVAPNVPFKHFPSLKNGRDKRNAQEKEGV